MWWGIFSGTSHWIKGQNKPISSIGSCRGCSCRNCFWLESESRGAHSCRSSGYRPMAYVYIVLELTGHLATIWNYNTLPQKVLMTNFWHSNSCAPMVTWLHFRCWAVRTHLWPSAVSHNHVKGFTFFCQNLAFASGFWQKPAIANNVFD